jgi:hypothetical protein
MCCRGKGTYLPNHSQEGVEQRTAFSRSGNRHVSGLCSRNEITGVSVSGNGRYDRAGT